MESVDFIRHYIIRYLSARELVLPPGMLTLHWVTSQYDLPNHTNQQIQKVWKPYLACRQHFQKPPDRMIHLSNLYSATTTDLAYSGVCAPLVSLFPNA